MSLPTEKKRMVPWVEKYRPDKVSDVSHQDEVVRALKTSIELGQLPHLMFHGPPGTGKTTTILAVAKELYGPELYRARVLELNASDERGIKVVREKIKNFAQGAVGGQKTAGYKCPRFKIIILDEADTMTPEAQSALRRIMEQYSKVTRFCLVCNYVTRIIEPLASRCAKFRFRPLPAESMVDRMNKIASAENVCLAEGSLATILRVSLGDMRKAVTYLQSSSQLSGGNAVTSALVTDLSGEVPLEVMDKYVSVLSGKSYDAMRFYVEEIIYLGYPINAILSTLHDKIIRNDQISDLNKSLICEKIAIVDQCLVDGSSETLQLLDLSSFIMRKLSGFSVGADAKRSH